MAGLESILSQIAEDARREADEKRQDARMKAEELICAAEEACKASSDALLHGGQERAAAIRERAVSAAQLQKRNRQLLAKQELIREVIDQTRLSLEQTEPEEYFSFLIRLAKRFARPGSCEMHLNEKDVARLPADFEKKLALAVPQTQISVSKEPRKLENGFLLVYGGIDINCTFRAVFEDADDTLRDAVSKILFAGS